MSRTEFLGNPDYKKMFEDAEDKIAELEDKIASLENELADDTKVARLISTDKQESDNANE